MIRSYERKFFLLVVKSLIFTPGKLIFEVASSSASLTKQNIFKFCQNFLFVIFRRQLMLIMPTSLAIYALD